MMDTIKELVDDQFKVSYFDTKKFTKAKTNFTFLVDADIFAPYILPTATTR